MYGLNGIGIALTSAGWFSLDEKTRPIGGEGKNQNQRRLEE
jgi:hypothetical protein